MTHPTAHALGVYTLPGTRSDEIGFMSDLFRFIARMLPHNGNCVSVGIGRKHGLRKLKVFIR